MDIDKFVKEISGNNGQTSNKVPFIRAKDVAAEFFALGKQMGNTPEKMLRIRGNDLLHKILVSLSKGRADDQKAVASIAKEIVEHGWCGPAQDNEP